MLDRLLAMSIDLRPPFADLTFMTPLSESRARQLAGFLVTDLTGTVLDLGCGWAECYCGR